MNPANHAHASCLCGAVRIHAELPSLWLAHCHCSMCRRAHGAAFVTWVGFPAERCRIDDPDRALRWFASSVEAERGFCGRCGSSLAFRSSRWPGELHLSVGNFDTPLDRTPQAHVFWDAHVAWAAVDPNDGLPRKSTIGTA